MRRRARRHHLLQTHLWRHSKSQPTGQLETSPAEGPGHPVDELLIIRVGHFCKLLFHIIVHSAKWIIQIQHILQIGNFYGRQTHTFLGKDSLLTHVMFLPLLLIATGHAQPQVVFDAHPAEIQVLVPLPLGNIKMRILQKYLRQDRPQSSVEPSKIQEQLFVPFIVSVCLLYTYPTS